MTRRDYIAHLNCMRDLVIKIIKCDIDKKKEDGPLAGMTGLEEDRSKKTLKMLDDVETRLYEDAAISMRIMEEKRNAGDFEQAEFSFSSSVGGEA